MLLWHNCMAGRVGKVGLGATLPRLILKSHFHLSKPFSNIPIHNSGKYSSCIPSPSYVPNCFHHSTPPSRSHLTTQSNQLAASHQPARLSPARRALTSWNSSHSEALTAKLSQRSSHMRSISLPSLTTQRLSHLPPSHDPAFLVFPALGTGIHQHSFIGSQTQRVKLEQIAVK